MGSLFSRQSSAAKNLVSVDLESCPESLTTFEPNEPEEPEELRDPTILDAASQTDHEKKERLDSPSTTRMDPLTEASKDNLCIIAICGAMNSGKDTLAVEIRSQLQETCKVSFMSFGSYVKDTICSTFGVDYEFIESWKRVDIAPPTFHRPMRELLQHVGDLRTFKSDYWVTKLLSDLPSSGWVIVTDVRYKNELEALKERGAYVLSVTRPSLNTVQDTSTKHSSECEIVDLINDCVNGTDTAQKHHTRCLAVSSPYFNSLFVNGDDGMARLRSACSKEVLRIITHFISPSTTNQLRTSASIEDVIAEEAS